MQSLLDNLQVNKGANGRDSLTLADVLEICRDQLSGVALVPTGMMGGVSTMIEKGVLGVAKVPSIKQGGASSTVEIPAPTS